MSKFLDLENRLGLGIDYDHIRRHNGILVLCFVVASI